MGCTARKVDRLKLQMVPKLVGSDTELGNFVVFSDGSPGRPLEAAQRVLAEIHGVPATMASLLPVEPLTDPYCADTISLDSSLIPEGYNQGWNWQDMGRKFLPSNGGACYVDMAHLELCTPEVRSAYDFVATWHAMLKVARLALEQANKRLAPEGRIELLARNSDGLGNSWGSHMNVLVSRRLWNRLMKRNLLMLGFLASFQVSSIVFTGQGKVGAENNQDPAHYLLSQRGDFFESVLGLQTTWQRPIVNCRDEPLCGPADPNRSNVPGNTLARLHVIFYDVNLAHVANLLKAGLLQICLAMLEREQYLPGLVLQDPLKALAVWNRDPKLESTAPVASGSELTAVEWQLCFLEKAHKLCSQGFFEGCVPDAEAIVRLALDTAEKLHEKRFEEVSARLDWVLKLRILETVMSKCSGFGWNSPRAKHLDLLYSALSEQGLFWKYDRAGFVERVVSEEQIDRLTHEPPTDTRAWTRAMVLRCFDPRSISQVDWDVVRFRFVDRDGTLRRWRLNLAHPARHTKRQCEPHFAALHSPIELLEELGAIEEASIAWSTSYSTGWSEEIKPASVDSLQPNQTATTLDLTTAETISGNRRFGGCPDAGT